MAPTSEPKDAWGDTFSAVKADTQKRRWHFDVENVFARGISRAQQNWLGF